MPFVDEGQCLCVVLFFFHFFQLSWKPPFPCLLLGRGCFLPVGEMSPDSCCPSLPASSLGCCHLSDFILQRIKLVSPFTCWSKQEARGEPPSFSSVSILSQIPGSRVEIDLFSCLPFKGGNPSCDFQVSRWHLCFPSFLC